MPYWIRGRDSQTGEPTTPFFRETDNESAAQVEAITRGMIVDFIVRRGAEKAKDLLSAGATNFSVQWTLANSNLRLSSERGMP